MINFERLNHAITQPFYDAAQDIEDAFDDAADAIMNAPARAKSAAINALEDFGDAVAQTPEAIKNEVINAAESAKQSLISKMKDVVCYTTGLTNLKSAYDRLTEPVSYKVVQTPGNAELVAYSPWIHERVKNAAGEVTICGGKVLSNLLYLTGAACAASEAVGLSSPCRAFSAPGAGKLVFDTVNTAVVSAFKYVAAPLTTHVVAPAVQYVVLPTAGNVLSIVENNMVNTGLLAGVIGLAYFGKNDIQAALSQAEIHTYVINGRVHVVPSNGMPCTEKAGLLAKGVAKIAGSALLLSLAAAYNS